MSMRRPRHCDSVNSFAIDIESGSERRKMLLQARMNQPKLDYKFRTA